MSVLETAGKLMGSIAGKMMSLPGLSQGLIDGMMSNMDPKIIAGAVNNNGKFMSGVIANLDPKALAGPINANPDFMTKLIKELDPGGHR